MANKLKVEELRTQLAQRGLDTAGTKSALVRRLESAILKDNMSSTDAIDASVGRKRQRESEIGESDTPQKVKAVEKLREMGVRQLREQATLRGISANGSKKELLERLSIELDKDRRLESAILKDNVPSTDMIVGSVGRKRPREAENGDSDALEKVKAVEKLREMGVRQLREQATLRGISANGSKKELLERLSIELDKDQRLELAIIKDNVSSTDAIDTSVGRKRPRESENGDSDKLEKVKAVEKLREMGIRQLREQSTLRGISANGSKKELLERLSIELDKDSQQTAEAEEKLDGSRKEKLVTATKKGGAVLDQWLPDHVKANYHVLQNGDEIYNAILNQTNVAENNNKFYVIQALESDGGGMFMVYFRWGRVGVKGQDRLDGPYTQDRAIREFETNFFAKTRNEWSNRKEFVCYPKCYTWLEMDYSKKENESVPKEPADSLNGIQPRETRLEPRVAKFISLICNISMMKQHMLEIGYNAEKLPLGKLSKATILKGYSVLKRIADVISQSDRKKIELLSGEFYTVIPHDFGFKKMREFVIDTPFKLKCKLEMVEALGEIEVATKLLKDDLVMQEDPLYSHYQHLHCELTPVDIDSKEFSMIEKYVQNTHAKTHSSYTVDIVQVFMVSREGEQERFKKFSSSNNRMLLWHGSRLTNWTGILSQGLRIAPPEAPVTGYMFGKGVYFADMFSKSANYCYSSHASRAGVLLLCEVALGEMAELLTANYNADQLPEGKLSTKGIGATVPDPSEFRTLEDGVIVPLGKPKEQPDPKGSLLYNEYIVYNVDQIQMRYIVQVNFNFKR